MNARALTAGLLTGALWALGGCRSAPAPAVLGEIARASDTPLLATDLYPAGEKRFVLLDPESGSPVHVEITHNPAPDPGGDWTQRVTLEALDGTAYAGDSDERASSTTLTRVSDGSVAMRHLIARTPSATSTDDALYVFEPPLVMAPAQLGPGDEFRHACELNIVELDDHNAVIKRGSGERTLRIVGAQTLDTERGEIETVLVRAELTLVMGAIRSVTVSDLWVEQGVGVIAESSQRVSRLMGVPVSRASSLKRLESSLDREPTAGQSSR